MNKKSPPKAADPAVRCAFKTMVPTAKVKPNKANPNRHGPEQIALLAKVIAATGWRSPVVVSTRSGLVVKGHGRLEAARLAGWKLVPVDFQDYADTDTEVADMLADNRLAELADMDAAAMKELLGALDTSKVDLELAGYTADALAALNSQFYGPPTSPKVGAGEVDDEDVAETKFKKAWVKPLPPQAPKPAARPAKKKKP